VEPLCLKRNLVKKPLLALGDTTMSKKKKNQKKIKERNWITVAAIQRKSGAHKDRKKEQSKRACRGKVKDQEKS
jgi:hypothetical protein